MSNVAVLRSERAVPAAEEDYLGPANVVRLSAEGVFVELPSGRTTLATLALAFPYEPAESDVLLVISKGKDAYVIGVLKGSGRAVLSIPGDVDVRAAGGTLTLSGDKGVRVTGPEVELAADNLVMAADALVQKLNSAYQRVRSLLTVHAGQSRTIVDETALSKSKNAVVLTEEKMAINGKEIHLG